MLGALWCISTPAVLCSPIRSPISLLPPPWSFPLNTRKVIWNICKIILWKRGSSIGTAFVRIANIWILSVAYLHIKRDHSWWRIGPRKDCNGRLVNERSVLGDRRFPSIHLSIHPTYHTIKPWLPRDTGKHKRLLNFKRLNFASLVLSCLLVYCSYGWENVDPFTSVSFWLFIKCLLYWSIHCPRSSFYAGPLSCLTCQAPQTTPSWKEGTNSRSLQTPQEDLFPDSLITVLPLYVSDSWLHSLNFSICYTPFCLKTHHIRLPTFQTLGVHKILNSVRSPSSSISPGFRWETPPIQNLTGTNQSNLPAKRRSNSLQEEFYLQH